MCKRTEKNNNFKAFRLRSAIHFALGIGVTLTAASSVQAVELQAPGDTLPRPNSVGLGHQFGSSVAVSEQLALAGVPGPDPNFSSPSSLIPGSVVVYRRSFLPGGQDANWDEEAVLQATDGIDGDLFGAAVAITASGQFAAVGSPRRDVAGQLDAGAVYLFERSEVNELVTWTQIRRLDAATPVAEARLGVSVAMESSGLSLIAGATRDSANGSALRGAAYILLQGADWLGAPIKVTAEANSSEGAFFGASVSVSGSTAMVGSPLEPEQGETQAGAAYLFDATTGVRIERFVSDAVPRGGDLFGASVALSGGKALVGAWFDEPLSNLDDTFNSGAVYAFENASTGSWLFEQRIEPSVVDGQTAADAADVILAQFPDTDPRFLGLQFGRSLAVQGNVALVGSNFKAVYPTSYVNAIGWSVAEDQAVLRVASEQIGFGESVSLFGTQVIVVGAPFETNARGNVYAGVQALSLPSVPALPLPFTLFLSGALAMLGVSLARRS